jgi:hypothetical protein
MALVTLLPEPRFSHKRPLPELQKELQEQQARYRKLRREVDSHPEMLKLKLGLPPLLALVEGEDLTRFDTELQHDYDSWPVQGSAIKQKARFRCTVEYHGKTTQIIAYRETDDNWVLDDDSEDLVWDCVRGEGPDDPDFAYPYDWDRLWARFVKENGGDVARAVCCLSWWRLNLALDSEGRPAELLEDKLEGTHGKSDEEEDDDEGPTETLASAPSVTAAQAGYKFPPEEEP